MTQSEVLLEITTNLSRAIENLSESVVNLKSTQNKILDRLNKMEKQIVELQKATEVEDEGWSNEQEEKYYKKIVGEED